MSITPTVVVLTPEELGDLLERSAQRAVSRALERSRSEMKQFLDEVRAARGILNKDQACAFFTCNADTLRKYRRNGLKCYKVGQQVFFQMEDIEAFIKQSSEQLSR